MRLVFGTVSLTATDSGVHAADPSWATSVPKCVHEVVMTIHSVDAGGGNGHDSGYGRLTAPLLPV